jgi:hypothetical protein
MGSTFTTMVSFQRAGWTGSGGRSNTPQASELMLATETRRVREFGLGFFGVTPRVERKRCFQATSRKGWDVPKVLIDFEFAAVFPQQRSPSPVALDLRVMRQALGELSGLTVAQN